MGKKQDKTNVMRILDQKKINYKCFEYDNTKLSATQVAQSLNIKVGMLFKTLVTVAKSKEHYVFMVPAEKELDLKKAAKAAGEKSIEMLPQKELLPLTGYIHGGCSPIGMKKQYKTFIDITAVDHEEIFFSAGKIGHQVCMPLTSLQKAISVTPIDIVKDK
ncbi:MAG: Cys-tRNA(Pro) deacylase [Oscillospiraceae bacterium]|nr:Cys-tRNA(Pro) deacylase [Oscillospiraceae bacterium]